MRVTITGPDAAQALSELVANVHYDNLRVTVCSRPDTEADPEDRFSADDRAAMEHSLSKGYVTCGVDELARLLAAHDEARHPGKVLVDLWSYRDPDNEIVQSRHVHVDGDGNV